MVAHDFTGVMTNPLGTKRHYKDGLLHRDGDLPAVTGDEFQEWWEYGKLHRIDGKAAVEYSNGGKQWWEYGEFIEEYRPIELLSDGMIKAGLFKGTIARFKTHLAPKPPLYSIPLYEADLKRIEKEIAEQESKK